MKQRRSKNIVIKKRRGRLPGSKDKKKRIRRTKAEIRRVESIKRHWAQKENPETHTLRMVAIATITEDPINGKNCQVKIQKSSAPPVANCEKLLFKITYEHDKVPAHSIIRHLRAFSEALAYSLKDPFD